MDIRQLNVLMAVADHGSFSAAARQLHTVQSNVSTHIARLERELGEELIDRTTGTLTTAGEAVVERARRIQGELDAIGPDLAAMRDEITGTARIGLIGTVGRWLLPPLLERLATDYPRLSLQVIEATTTSLVPQVATSTLHVAIVNLPIDDHDLESEPLFDEARVLVVRSDDELGKRKAIDASELADLPVLLAPQGTSFRNEVDDELRQLGLTLSPQAEVDGMSLLAAVVRAGHGVALLPASGVPGDGSCVSVPVDGLAPRLVGMAWNRRVPPSAATRTVAELMRELIADEIETRPGLEPVLHAPHLPPT